LLFDGWNLCCGYGYIKGSLEADCVVRKRRLRYGSGSGWRVGSQREEELRHVLPHCTFVILLYGFETRNSREVERWRGGNGGAEKRGRWSA
jgi:hypothetical protein